MKRFLVGGAALAALLGLGLDAHAGFQYSGTMCRPGRGDASKVTYNTNLGVYNDSTSTAKVYCPVPFDDDRVPAFILVDVIDQNASADVSCTLTHLQLGGTPIFSQTQKTSGSSSGVQTLSFDPIDPEQGLLLTCTLPPQTSSGKPSRVVDYKIDLR